MQGELQQPSEAFEPVQLKSFRRESNMQCTSQPSSLGQELELHKLRRLYDALVANHRSALSEKEHVEAELRRARTTARVSRVFNVEGLFLLEKLKEAKETRLGCLFFRTCSPK